MILADDCIVCGKWPEQDRWALREMNDTLPMDEDPICDKCLMAFWKNCMVGPDNPPDDH